MAKKALGRGLRALIPDTPQLGAGFAQARVDQLRPNPDQPRRRFDEGELAALAASIREHGVLQPLLVSEDGPGRYRILAGERRWRAARQAGLERVPVVIRERVDALEALELALVENLQRRDLTPLEEARAYESLRTARGLSQAAIAERVGFDRSTVANALRLLKLPLEVQELVEDGRLSAGHARALLTFTEAADRVSWAQRAVADGLSVRELEAAAATCRASAAPTPTRPRRRASGDDDPNLREAAERLTRALGVPVTIQRHGRRSRIVIRCDNEGELIRVYELMMGGDDGAVK
jgi:ParB family chromosome partitioning protein